MTAPDPKQPLFSCIATALLLLGAGSTTAQMTPRIETLAELPGKSPEGAGWGADGALYLSSVNTFEVLRYRDGTIEPFAITPIRTLSIAAGPGELVVNGHIDVDRRDERAMAGAGRVAVLGYDGRLRRIIPVGSLPNGITHYRDHQYFCSDTNEGRIWLVDTMAGTATAWMDDPVFRRVTNDRRAGINGLRWHQGYLYIASTVREAVFRVKVGDDGQPASALERMGFAHYADDIDVARDGTVYVATRNAIARISPRGETTDLTDGATVEGGPALVLAPDGRSLFMVTQGRIMRPAWGPPGQPSTPPAAATPDSTPLPAPVPKLMRIWLPDHERR